MFVILFIAIVVGSWFAKVEIVARGAGRIVPTGRIQAIQSQFSGKINEVLVTEGSYVKAGETLVYLESVQQEAELDQLKAEFNREILALNAAESILKPLENSDPTDNGFVEMGKSYLLEASNNYKTVNSAKLEILVTSTLSAIRARVAEIDAKFQRYEKAISTQGARITWIERELKLVSERNSSAEALYKSGTITRLEYLDRTRVTQDVQKEFEIANKQKDEFEALKIEARTQRDSIISGALTKYHSDFFQAQTAVDKLSAKIKASSSKLENTKIVSPIDGCTDNLKILQMELLLMLVK